MLLVLAMMMLIRTISNATLKDAIELLGVFDDAWTVDDEEEGGGK